MRLLGGNNIECLIYWDLRQGAKIVDSPQNAQRTSAQMTTGANMLQSVDCIQMLRKFWILVRNKEKKSLIRICDFEKGSALRSTGVARKATKEKAEDRACTCAREKAVTRLTTYDKSRCLWVRTTCTCGMEIKSCCVWCGQWKCTEEKCRAERKVQDTEKLHA